MNPARRVGPLVAMAALLWTACPGANGGGPDADTWVGDTDAGGFDDHTVADFASVPAFTAFSDLGEQPVQGKFVIARWQAPEPGPVYWLESAFYTLHDEWYWFRLLNGASVPGVGTAPVVDGPSYDTVAQIYEAMLARPPGSLPLDLRFTSDGRLYSPEFYQLGLYDGPTRALILGSVLHYAPHPDRVVPEELWLFELEYADPADATDIARLFEILEARLPAEVTGSLRWLARSTAQEALASEIAAGGGPYAERTLTYADLVVAGAVGAYNEGLVAGTIHRVPKGELGVSSVGPEEIVILEEVPDFLPPVAGIVTAVPQTPLAHLNLLAKSRGTPNAYVAGVFDDDGLAEWELWHTPVVLAVSDGAVRFKPITTAEYTHYRELSAGADLHVPVADLTTAPDTLDLTKGSLATVHETVPLAGGKASGMMAFNDFPEIPIPATPLAITVAPYVDHLSIFKAVLSAMLASTDFKTDPRARFLVLEGEDAFRTSHAGDSAALAWLDEFTADNPADSFLGSIIAGGGFKEQLRAVPLGAAFASEDVQGFNGAGLYDSNTGYLHPELQDSDKLKKRSVEWALKKTWSSYWSFEAFEERRVAGIDHLDGRMAVLVHPRFDDDKELANGVITLFYAVEAGSPRAEMIVNAQDGAVSVTNPDPDDPTTPEIGTVSRVGGGEATLVRVQASSLVGAGEVVLSDADYHWLLDHLEPLTAAWLDQVNTALSPTQRRSTLVLDFEFKRMAQGWPELASGELLPKRLVLKQVRTLDSPLPVADDAVLEDDVPRDVLEQTISASERRCEGATASGERAVITTWEYLTNPAKAWALDYAERPFRSFVRVELPDGSAALGLPAGHSARFTHVDGDTQGVVTGASGWSLVATLPASAAAEAGFDRVEVTDTGAWLVAAGDSHMEGSAASCTTEPLLEGPIAYLQELLAD